MACKNLSAPGLPICAQSLRALPADTYPGGHVVLLPRGKWEAFMKDEDCRCDTPHLEWCLSPLGQPVEVRWGSAEHRLCIWDWPSESLRRDLLPHAHRGIVAEVLYANGEHFAFVDLVLADPSAAHHILSLRQCYVHSRPLPLAQHTVRVALARVAAAAAAKEALR